MASFATHHNDEDSSDSDNNDPNEAVEALVDHPRETFPQQQRSDSSLEDDHDSASSDEDDEDDEMRVTQAERFQDAEEDDDEDDDDNADDDDALQLTATPRNIRPAAPTVRAAPAAPTITRVMVKTEDQQQPPRNNNDSVINDDLQDMDDNDDDDSESGDGDLPLATPYPWAQDEYELTLHHDPKRKKPIGTGMVYLKRLTYDSEEQREQYEEATVLSPPAKTILKQLLQQQKKHTKVVKRDDEDSSEEEEEEEESDEEEEDDDEDEEAVMKRRQLPGPRLWTNIHRNDKSQHQNNDDDDDEQEESLFLSILQVMEDAHPLNVTTRHIIRVSALKLPPGAPPGGMDAKEFVCCALHFLSSEWKSPDPSQIPTLPLIRSNTAPGNARDLEKRSYQKAYHWNSKDLRPMLAELERFFYDSPSSASYHPALLTTTTMTTAKGSPHNNNNPLPWISRVRFCPRPPDPRGGRKGLGETTFLLKGQPIPARMTGQKRTSAGTTTTTSTTHHAAAGPTKPKKRKANPTSSSTGDEMPTTTGVVMRMDQGKRLPFQVHNHYGDEE